MRRSWITPIAVIFLLAGGAAISSCYTIRNTCSPTLKCCGTCGQGPVGTRPPERIKTIYKIRRGAVPNAFFVAIDPKGKCADRSDSTGGWVGRKLLPSGKEGAYCAYVWNGASLAEPNEKLLRNRDASGLDRVELDPPAIAIHQSTEDPPVAADGDELNAWFAARYQITRARLGEPSEGERPPQTASVRVAVIDTAAGSYYDGAIDPVGHGHAVGHLIEDIACKGQSPCRVEISNYGALPLMTSETGMLQIHGSGAAAYGTRAFLAEQIELAVNDWQTERATGAGPEHLVLNLSLGWSGCWNDKGADLKLDPVYQAILRASCQGVMVVAAGGNIEAVPGCPAESPGKGTTGEHVFPAQFLNHTDRPTVDACTNAGIDSAHQSLGPLLLGISAIDENDAQLVVADQESTLVAYGNAVVVPDGTSWTRQLSGTSMSAATVSGIAAAVWAAFPARTFTELERDLIEPAVLLRPRAATPATYICNALPQALPSAECANVRRASLCRSLAHAAGMSSECGPRAADATVEPVAPPSSLRGNVAATAAAADPNAPVEVAEACAPGAPGCPAPGPDAIDSTEQPWAVVGPQPAGNSCGTCQYTRSTQTFKGSFVSGTISGAKPGWVSLSTGDFDLWNNSMSSMSVTKKLSGAGKATKGKLWYTRDSDIGLVFYYETIVIK